MATNYAQKLQREAQSPKGNVLKGVAIGAVKKLGAISNKEEKFIKLSTLDRKLGKKLPNTLSPKSTKKIMTSDGYIPGNARTTKAHVK